MPRTSKKTQPDLTDYPTKGEVRELVDELLRSAIRTQARDLERHLVDIDARLRRLEEKQKKSLMPRYVYRCTCCEELSIIDHLSAEVETDCPKCSEAESLVKLLNTFTTKTSSLSHGSKVGETTERFIEDAREELKKQKDDLDKNR